MSCRGALGREVHIRRSHSISGFTNPQHLLKQPNPNTVKMKFLQLHLFFLICSVLLTLCGCRPAGPGLPDLNEEAEDPSRARAIWLQQHLKLDSNWLSDVVEITDESKARAQSHIGSPVARFLVRDDPLNPQVTVAYTPFVHVQPPPRTSKEWPHGVYILEVAKNSKARLLGEVRTSAGLTQVQRVSWFNYVAKYALHNRERMFEEYGRDILTLM